MLGDNIVLLCLYMYLEVDIDATTVSSLHVLISQYPVHVCFIFINVYVYSHFCSNFSVLWPFHSMFFFVLKIDPLLFTAEKSTGKTLFSMEKSDLKELGINTLGRRLEVYEKVKQLISKGEEKASAKSEGH